MESNIRTERNIERMIGFSAEWVGNYGHTFSECTIHIGYWGGNWTIELSSHGTPEGEE